MREVVSIDLFAGGGGASEGIRLATGRAPIVAVNHDPAAIAMHARNHPGTVHLCESVFDVEPLETVEGQTVDLLWASPDCTHFSRAKGGKPRKREIRALAWVVVDWARRVRPRVLVVENVAEFETWGPLDGAGQPIKDRAGETFRQWLRELAALGYVVEWRVLSAADYGAPTTRRRLFIVARCDGQTIRWPAPTHGPDRAQPHRTAAECIDWSIPCPSIFGRKRPLAEATQRRIAEGIRRYVLGAERPFIVEGVAPTLIQTGYGERKGQAPRILDLHSPLGTVVATGQKHALVAAFLAKHNGSGAKWNAAVGHDLDEPMHTVTGRDTKALVAAHLTKFYGTSTGSDLGSPAPTVTGQGWHIGLVAAFLLKYYGSGGQWQDLRDPLHTIVAKARFGLVTVTVDGEEYAIADIGMRMLQPRELARAQGFGDEYVLTGTKTQQVARIGNSVSPPVARAIVEAQFRDDRPVEQQELFEARAAK